MNTTTTNNQTKESTTMNTTPETHIELTPLQNEIGYALTKILDAFRPANPNNPFDCGGYITSRIQGSERMIDTIKSVRTNEELITMIDELTTTQVAIFADTMNDIARMAVAVQASAASLVALVKAQKGAQ